MKTTKKTYDKQTVSKSLKDQAASLERLYANTDNATDPNLENLSPDTIPTPSHHQTESNQHNQTGHNQTAATNNENDENTTNTTTATTSVCSNAVCDSVVESNNDETMCLGDDIDMNMDNTNPDELKKVSQAGAPVDDNAAADITLVQVKPDEPGEILPTPQNLKKVSQAGAKEVLPVVPSSNPYIMSRKSAMLYLTSYAQNLTEEQLSLLYHSPRKKTIAENEALTVLMGVVQKNPEERKRYWDIEKRIAAQAARKKEENTPKPAKSSLFDDAMAEINAMIEGETVDTPNQP